MIDFSPENTLFFMPTLTGIIFLLVASFMYYYPSKKINYLYGYRTKSSMKSKERWDFAQLYSARKMILYGTLLALFGLLGLIVDFSENIELTISISSLLIVVFLLLVQTEKAIKWKFE